MDVDPDTMLEWLGVPGDMQVVALEQLCMLLLLSDNVDRYETNMRICNDDDDLNCFYSTHCVKTCFRYH